MKSVTISSKRIKTEFYIWLACLVTALILNIFSIIFYNTKWIELITQLGYVFAVSLVIYMLSGIIRLFITGIKRIVQKR